MAFFKGRRHYSSRTKSATLRGINPTPAPMMWPMVDGTDGKGNGHKPPADMKPNIVPGLAETAQLPAPPGRIELTQAPPAPSKHRNRLTNSQTNALPPSSTC